ncbi:MAG: universal stress protein [Aequorivita sp.]|nr:universal stress protein [Aequorivita sp.]
MAYSKILIAVDSSEFSMLAAKKGLELAHQTGAKVALIYVIDESKAVGNVNAGILPQTALLILKKEAEQTLDELAKMYNGHEILKFMPEGHPAKDIIKTAETWEADLIVMGTHGRTGLAHLFVGSVAEHVIHHSKIPVMIVPLK